MADNVCTGPAVTVIGADCTFKGEAAFEGSMKVEGKVTSRGKLSRGRGAPIAADVTAGQIPVERSLPRRSGSISPPAPTSWGTSAPRSS